MFVHYRRIPMQSNNCYYPSLMCAVEQT